jgi:hypothetical protein
MGSFRGLSPAIHSFALPRIVVDSIGSNYGAAHYSGIAQRVAEWVYEQTERASGQVWVTKDVFRHLGPEWRRILVA